MTTRILTLFVLAIAFASPASAAEIARDIRTSIVRIDTVDGSIGTGFVIDERGYIATNDHVVRKDFFSTHAKVAVTFRTPSGDAVRVEGEVWGSDRAADLAVVKIDPKIPSLNPFTEPDGNGRKLVALRWASDASIGSDVLAIGFPWGHAGLPTVTRGIVSAVGRKNPVSDRVSGLIQTDAAVNPGNSGGPLVNLKGEVVGVNTCSYDTKIRGETLRLAVTDENGQPVVMEVADKDAKDGKKKVPLFVTIPVRERISEGIHYARGFDTARPVVEKLIRDRKVVRASLGFEAITQRVMIFEGNKPSTVTEGFSADGGARVTSLSVDSPASKAGLKVGDVIERILVDGHERLVRSIGDINDILVGLKSGSKVKVLVRRTGTFDNVQVEYSLQ